MSGKRGASSDTRSISRATNDEFKSCGRLGDNRMSDSLFGFVDYRNFPYALGDTITLLMNMEVLRQLEGKQDIVQLILTYPGSPSSRLQPFINRNNFRNFLIELFPAFLFSPNTSSLSFTESRPFFHYRLVQSTLRRDAVWPGIFAQARGSMDFISHRRINKFFLKNGHLPRLDAPERLRIRAREHLSTLFAGKSLVTVNLRNSKSSYFFSAPHREANIPEWEKFFRLSARSHPDVMFLIVGSFSEWSRSLLEFPNVAISRRLGLGLADELSLLLQSRLFMGSSSGFSALATFSTVPYLIINFEPGAAKYVGLGVGERRYPFAEKNQVILWGQEQASELYREFCEAVE